MKPGTSSNKSETKGVMPVVFGQARTINPILKLHLHARTQETIRANNIFSGKQKVETHLDFGAANCLSTKLLHYRLKANCSIGIEYSAGHSDWISR